MTTRNLNVAHSSDGVSSQLSLPTGPVGLVRPRRERTDEDKAWYSKQLAVKHSKHWDKVVYEKVAYYASLNPEREAYPSVARVAREVLCSDRTVRYALRRLEASGLIACISKKGGRLTSRYRVGADCSPGLQGVQPRAARGAAEVIREGKRVSKTRSSLSAVSKSLDPVKPEGPQEQEVLPTGLFPSKKKKQEEAPLTEAQEPAFQNSKQVGMLCSVARKLGREVSEYEQRAFDQLSHERKILTLKPLLEAEQSLAAEGVVAAPPKAAPSPRHEVAHHHEGKSTSTRPACTEHRWTPPASDGVQNCHDCDEERPGI